MTGGMVQDDCRCLLRQIRPLLAAVQEAEAKVRAVEGMPLLAIRL